MSSIGRSPNSSNVFNSLIVEVLFVPNTIHWFLALQFLCRDLHFLPFLLRLNRPTHQVFEKCTHTVFMVVDVPKFRLLFQHHFSVHFHYFFMFLHQPPNFIAVVLPTWPRNVIQISVSIALVQKLAMALLT